MRKAARLGQAFKKSGNTAGGKDSHLCINHTHPYPDIPASGGMVGGWQSRT
jgi:hypothetical protein